VEATWIRWAELEAIDWLLHHATLSEGWQQLFDMMNLLSKNSHVDDVRLVVDFFKDAHSRLFEP